MDITIHYRGKLDDPTRLSELLDAAQLYCAEQRWARLELDEQIVGTLERPVETMRGERDSIVVPIDDTLRGLVITPNARAEPFWLTFNGSGELVYYMPLDDTGAYWEHPSLFVRTRRAGMETHIALCEFFHFLQEAFMPGLRVYDQAGYFESGDADRLATFFQGTAQNDPFQDASDADDEAARREAFAADDEADAEAPAPTPPLDLVPKKNKRTASPSSKVTRFS